MVLQMAALACFPPAGVEPIARLAAVT